MENEYLDTALVKDEVQYDYADFGVRLGASLLDYLIVGIPMSGLLVWSYYSNNMVIAIVTTLIGGLYKPIMESIYGATPGKMILGLKVVDSNFEKVDIVQSFTKNAIYLISSAFALASTFTIFGSGALNDADSFVESMAAMGEGNIYATLANVWIVVILISCFAMLADNIKKQTLHDKLANTFLVKKRKF